MLTWTVRGPAGVLKVTVCVPGGNLPRAMAMRGGQGAPGALVGRFGHHRSPGGHGEGGKAEQSSVLLLRLMLQRLYWATALAVERMNARSMMPGISSFSARRAIGSTLVIGTGTSVALPSTRSSAGTKPGVLGCASPETISVSGSASR